MHLRERIETGIIVTLIAVMIWLYAEAENVKVYSEPVTVRLVPAPGKDLRLSPGEPFRVFLSYKGSTGQNQAMSQLISEKEFTLEVGGKASEEPTDESVNLRDYFTQLRAFTDLGVEIISSEPDTVIARIDPVRTISLRVAVPASMSTPHAELGLSVEPREIPVRLPASQMERALSAQIVPSLQGIDFSQYAANTPHTLTLPVELPSTLDRQQIRLTQESVQLTFTVRKSSDSYQPAFIPIRLNVQPRLLQQYDIDLPDDQLGVRDVRLSGPTDIIARLRSGQLDVWAELRFSADDLARRSGGDGGFQPAPLVIDVPPGISVDTAVPRVDVRVRRTTP